MGNRTFNTGSLSSVITVDPITLNVGIGGAPTAYKANVTGAVAATNFVLSGATGNTGIYYGHTDRVVLANYTAGGIDFEVNGGSVSMTLFPTGNFSIGTAATDAGYKLDVAGTGRFTTSSGTIATFSASTQSQVKIVGNTNTSDVGLRIEANSQAWSVGMNFFSAVGGTDFMIFNGTAATIPFRINTSGAATFSSSVTAGGQLEGGIVNSTANTFRFSGNNALSLVTLTGQSVVKINAAGFWGVQLVGANDQGIVINNSGNVGINETAPNTKLDIVGASNNASTYGTLTLRNSSQTGISFGALSTSYTWIQGNIFGSGVANIALNPNGGNVLIGSTTDNGNKLQVNGNISLGAGNGSISLIDSSGTFITLNNGSTQNFGSFSGMIIVNNYGTGAVQVFVCGGGSTASVYLLGGALGTLVYNGSINGYIFTNNTGSTYIYNFTAIRTRSNA